MLSLKLSRALKLLETVILLLLSLVESTLELPSSFPHLLGRDLIGFELTNGELVGVTLSL